MNKYEWIQQLSFDEMVKFLVDRDIKLARQMNAELEDGYEKKLKKDLLKECNFATEKYKRQHFGICRHCNNMFGNMEINRNYRFFILPRQN